MSVALVTKDHDLKFQNVSAPLVVAEASVPVILVLVITRKLLLVEVAVSVRLLTADKRNRVSSDPAEIAVAVLRYY